MIQEVVYDTKWIPFAGPDEQNYLGLDLNPGSRGTAGQVINFDADEFIYKGSRRYVLASSFTDFMRFLADHFGKGTVEVADPDNPRYLKLVRAAVRMGSIATCSRA